jgi:transposase-like protein/DDE family transposase
MTVAQDTYRRRRGPVRCRFYEAPDEGRCPCLGLHDGGRDAGGTRAEYSKGTGMDAIPTFGERNFGGVDLGDVRRSRRLVNAVDAMCCHPAGTLPDKLNQPKMLRAFYRLVNREEVTHAVLIQSQADETRRRIAALAAAEDVTVVSAAATAAATVATSTPNQAATVLILHDATELDYTTLKALQERLGQIGQGTRRGYICHNSLAVCADGGEIIGLTSQILHHRAKVHKGETTKQSRQRVNRESRLWLRGAKASGPAPAGVPCVDVSDTLSDTFEYMSYEVTHGRHFVLRAKENRKLAQAVAGEDYLFDATRRLPSVGTRPLTVKASPGRTARKTTVHVSFSKVRLALPGEKLGDYKPVPLDLWVVRVWEPNTPAGEEPLEWILLTNVAVDTFADADERVAWYEKRWIVEEYHKGLKTGCGIETMQFDTIEALEPAIAVISALATTLLTLRDAVRAPDAETRPATDVIAPVYVEVLVAHYGKRLKARPSVKAFYMHVARLGGHQNRKCDGLPGWITLWRGWMKLQSMVDGYQAARLNHARCGKN